MPDTPKLTFQGRQPTPEEIAKLAEDQPFYDSFPLYIRVVHVPENLTRRAYTVVRGIYLAIGDELVQLMKNAGKPDEKIWRKQFEDCKRRLDEADAWLKPPMEPLSLENASKVLKAMGNSSAPVREAAHDFLTKHVGKRPRRGQPASKRHLALIALDSKCAYPILSLRDIMEPLCPCGKPRLCLTEPSEERSVGQEFVLLGKMKRGDIMR